MHKVDSFTIRAIIFIIFSLVSDVVPAQRKLDLEPDNWAIELTKGGLTEVNSMGSLKNLLMAVDSVRAFSFLDSLETSKNAKGHFFKSHFCMVKADFLFSKFADYDKYKNRGSKELLPIKEQMMKLYADAIDASNYTEDDRTIGWVNFYSAKRMRSFGEIGWAVMYAKNGVELFERAVYPVEPPVYTDLADLLYQVREYDESIIYAKKGILAWKKMDYENTYKDPYKLKTKALYTIGNAFYKKNQLDSANIYHQQALQLATENKDTFLTAVVLGNMGRVLYAQNKFDSAYFLFKTDYLKSKDDSIYNDAANAAHWMAKASLARGNKETALAEAREALRLLSLWPNEAYLRDTYSTLTQIFRSKGNYDSAFYYNNLYVNLNDSIEKIINTSSIAISKAKVNDEFSRYKIKSLNKEKQSQLLIKNVIIVGVILLSLSALFIVNRNRLAMKMKIEKAEQEIISAREQMKMFTDNIIEKTNLVEKLQNQVNSKQDTADRQLLITELSNQTILTEDEWVNFKNVFEKIYPDFFIKLKEKAPEVTAAEQRMAALIRIQLTTKQIASMLGISVDGVYKTRQRLKQRINSIDDEIDVDEFITNI